MVCPSDHLEPIINERFEGDKFYFTSLGNMIDLDQTILRQLSCLIEKRNIARITFVLSEDNDIVNDALTKQLYSKNIKLQEEYYSLIEHQKNSIAFWQTNNYQSTILSYHLNSKIKELRNGLSKFLTRRIDFDGRLFSKDYNSFRNICSASICMENNFLN